VQQSNAMESLSNVNILCLDKTGTLTANHILYHSLLATNISEAELRELLGDYAASISAGNRTNDAIAASCPGQKLPVSDEVDFSSQRKWSGLVFAGDERKGAYILGAPEMLAPGLSAGLGKLQEEIDSAADQGLRVLLLAHAPHTSSLHKSKDHPRLPDGLRHLGLVILSDELRHEASATLARFAKAGVQLKIISGDNPQTVAALARQAGMDKDMCLVSGLDLEGLSPAELGKKAQEGDVFGRITPQQKEELVRSLRAQGNYVAMIGDGVNDVLSLKQANLGIAMQSGSQAARGVADIILLNDSFAALPTAVNEGQRIINGMQDILKLFLTRVFVTALLVLSIEIVGGFPFSPRHSSLLALVTVGIPTLALAAWARPGPPHKNIVRWLLRFTVPASLTISLFGLIVYIGALAWRTGGSAGSLAESPALLAAQTALTIFTILCGLVLIPFVEPPTRFFTGGDRLSGDWRPTYMAIGLAILFAVLLAVPFFSSLFDMAVLEWWEYLALIGITLLWAVVCRWTWRSRLIDRLFYTDLG
jgi:cation-transporting ATPase E